MVTRCNRSLGLATLGQVLLDILLVPNTDPLRLTTLGLRAPITFTPLISGYKKWDKMVCVNLAWKSF